MKVLKSKRFVVRKSLVGTETTIEVTFKNGKVAKYEHDKVLEVMLPKLSTLNCWEKYKSYTSSSSVPVVARDLILTE